MVAAPIVRSGEADLRQLLRTMNSGPGRADPHNTLVPFGQFPTLHFARFVILKDATLDDLDVFGPDAKFADAPVYLAFLGDCDGSADALLAEFADRAGEGLRQVFAYCEGFQPSGDLLQWLRSHSIRPGAAYVNWIGRTVRQIQEEAELHKVLARCLAEYLENRELADRSKDQPRQIYDTLVHSVGTCGLQLTPPGPTPLGWQIRRLCNILAAAAAAFVAILPVLTLSAGTALLIYLAAILLVGVAAAAFIVCLRRHETTDADLQRPPSPPSDEHLLALGAPDDHDVTNQYTALGSFRPGLFPRWTTTIVWWLVNLATPILYPRGNLGRIKTIHFARWVFLDGKRRGLFVSNYDGSAESYMDDFVNKVAFGLNLTFSQGVGYPRTHFLLGGGAALEQDFKNTQRRHSLAAEVWYKAYPGLSLADIARNARIRQGLECQTMTDTEIRRWLSEI